MAAVFHQQSAGEELVRISPTLYGASTCKWFNTCLGLGFLTMTTMGGVTLDSPIKVFVHQSKIYTKGFHSWKDDEAVQFAFTESPKGLECIWVTGLGDAHCIDKKKPQRKDECYN
uniref:Lin-28 like protein A n=1 Tax=Columba livia TaxID=8932 RepID=R7VQC5_COLLI